VSNDAKHQIFSQCQWRGFLEKLLPKTAQGRFTQIGQRSEALAERRIGHNISLTGISNISASFGKKFKLNMTGSVVTSA
jgi:hypothetical protein